MGCDPMYLGYVWGLKEAFESLQSNFWSILKEKSKNIPQIKNPKKSQKITFLAKIQLLKKSFKWFKMMIYGMKWVPLMSYTCFKTIFTIRTCIETILGKSNFLADFWNFQLWVSGQKPRKTMKNREKPLKTIKNSFWPSRLFQKKFCPDTSA